ncbi:MAG: 3-deoxy-D-manno-octulosonic acid transferase [Acidobacteria bacterium]|nr:3-deoxy-D-manno-octulosonic acid transferase [Acidobacteriota bacterium]
MSRFVYFGYSIIVTVAILLALPILFLRRLAGGRPGILAGLGERLGWIPSAVDEDDPRPRNIWIHCVSVGEVMGAIELVKELRSRHKSRSVFLSTVTPAGREVAVRELSSIATVFYAPLDHPSAVKRVLGRTRPAALLLFETEIWPNTIRLARRSGASVAIVNGRISDRSFPRYRVIRKLLAPVLADIDCFLMQSPQDAERIRALGAPASKVHTMPNLKWQKACPDASEAGRWREVLAIPESSKVFVAGSTCAGEEEMILDAFDEIRKEVPGIRLVLAPRKPARFREVEQILAGRGVDFAIRSRRGNGAVVTLLDTIGELRSVYSIADVVFVGGSLVDAGGHNLLEPAAWAKPVLFGPYVSNFREMTRMLIDGGAARQVASRAELAPCLLEILRDPVEAARMGEAARRLLRTHADAVHTTADVLDRIVRGEECGC